MFDQPFAAGDWNNQLWIIGYTGEYLRQHWSFPRTFNTDQLIGIPFPIFYGTWLYPVAGMVSAFLGAAIAVRLVMVALFWLQTTQIIRLVRTVYSDRYTAWALAALVAFAVYPLGNLYDRGAFAEVAAASLLVSALAAWMRALYTDNPRSSAILASLAWFLLALSAGSHPGTAMLGIVLFGFVLVASLAITSDRFWIARTALYALLFVVVLSPWLYAVLKFHQDLALSHIKWAPTDQIGTSSFYTQANFGLLVVVGFLSVDACRRLRKGQLAVTNKLILPGACVALFVLAGLYPVSTVASLKSAYSPVTCCDLLLLLAAVPLLSVLRDFRPEIERWLRILLLLMTAAMAVGVLVKFDRVAAVETTGVLPGTGLLGERKSLAQLPPSFYGLRDYLNVAGVDVAASAPSSPSVDRKHPVSFTTPSSNSGGAFSSDAQVAMVPGVGPSFGEVQAAMPAAVRPLRLVTNVLSFGWNRLVVGGSELPPAASYVSPRGTLAFPWFPLDKTLGYRFVPDVPYNVLRFTSVTACFAWAAILLCAAVLEATGQPAIVERLGLGYRSLFASALAAVVEFFGRAIVVAGLVTLGFIVVTVLGVYRLAQFHHFYPNGLDWRGALEGIWPLLPITGWAAIRVSLFWGWSTAVIAGLLLAFDPALGLCDALLAGAAGLWFLGDFLGNILGPLGLFRAPLIWLLLAAGTLWLLRLRPRIRLRAPSMGQKLALLAFALMAVITLPIQLGSPVVPRVDALAWPSSAQRILTFHTYAPLNNDPYAVWAWSAQAPGTELFYALLALGSGTRLAVLAESAAMVPMLGLLAFGVYRLGRVLFDDLAGGFAALLLLFTIFHNTMQSMRPGVTAFALASIGLAFFLDARRSRTRMAIGAMLLGASIPSHAIDGAVAMAVAACAVVIWSAAKVRSRVRAGIGCLAGALLLGSPEFFVVFRIPLPYPILLLSQLAGVAVILGSARTLEGESVAGLTIPRTLGLAVFGALALMLPFESWLTVFAPGGDQSSIPLVVAQLLLTPLVLTTSGVVGLILLEVKLRTNPRAPAYAVLAAGVVLLGPVATLVLGVVDPYASSASARFMVSHPVGYLNLFWCPCFIALIGALAFALVWSRWSKSIALFVLLCPWIYPWQVTNPTHFLWQLLGHSMVEQSAYNLDIAARGYFSNCPDRRWSLSPEGFALVDILNREISAGRITMETHIPHVSFSPPSWDSPAEFALFTGINDDPIDKDFDPNDIYLADTRRRSFKQFVATFAEGAPYILDERDLPPGITYPGYEEIFDRERLHLFRRLALTANNVPAPAKFPPELGEPGVEAP